MPFVQGQEQDFSTYLTLCAHSRKFSPTGLTELQFCSNSLLPEFICQSLFMVGDVKLWKTSNKL